MGRLGRAVRGAMVGLLALSAAACADIYRNHGYTPTDNELAQISVGRDTRDTVAEIVGRPASSALLQDGAWYYVQSRYRHGGIGAPREIDRQVVAISFDQAGTVANIERFGLEQGRAVVLSRRVTETNIRGVSVIGQLLGNLGNLRAEQLID
ncbi:outer membrane protein assembly factor BamE [Plastorhodobacter daqingensis]|uniref:Outer membrane protein assembly factor BamE n=1 Tax=Plastorhodobacter daqingensis TaxID=1387281 RepID=A0ABW2UKN7_9RHOB